MAQTVNPSDRDLVEALCEIQKDECGKPLVIVGENRAGNTKRSNKWICKVQVDHNGRVVVCNKAIIVEVGSGVGNVAYHVRKNHVGWSNLYVARVRTEQAVIQDFVSSKSQKVHNWLCFIILNAFPFSAVEAETVTSYVKMGHISRTTFMKYFHAVTSKIWFGH